MPFQRICREEGNVLCLHGTLVRALDRAFLRLGLSREGTVVHFEVRAFDYSDVGWDQVTWISDTRDGEFSFGTCSFYVNLQLPNLRERRVTIFYLDNISDDEVMHWDLHTFRASDHGGEMGDHALKGFHDSI